MHLLPALTFSLLLSLLSFTTQAHNITRILAKHPEFSTFNHYLTITHLAAEINRRQTITVCAVDNAAMSGLLSKHLPLSSIKNVLSLHIITDYFGAKKLHQIPQGSTLTATMFQATGEATGTSGYVNITNLKGGKVRFGAENSGQLNSVYVKSLQEIPYNISVIHISQIISSADAEAPTGGPTNLNLMSIMSQKECKAFSNLLTKSGANETFVQSVDGGLTVFCPTDGVINAFMPKYKNLTSAGKVSLLLYHGVPVYNSMGMLRSNNGVMNTLATEGPNKFDFTIQNDGEDVKLETKAATATVTGTLVDEEPLAVFKIDKVLLPRELFKAEEETPVPKGEKEAEAPAPDASDEDPADVTASDNGCERVRGVRLVTLVLGLWWGGLVLL